MGLLKEGVISFRTQICLLVVASVGLPTIAVAEDTESVALRHESITLFDSGFSAKFEVDETYLRSIVELESGSFEKEGDYLRLYGEGEDSLWVRCADVISSACAGSASFIDRRRERERASGIPSCPNDPRCPKPDEKKED